jgi:hypothetical protein
MEMRMIIRLACWKRLSRESVVLEDFDLRTTGSNNTSICKKCYDEIVMEAESYLRNVLSISGFHRLYWCERMSFVTLPSEAWQHPSDLVSHPPGAYPKGRDSLYFRRMHFSAGGD